MSYWTVGWAWRCVWQLVGGWNRDTVYPCPCLGWLVWSFAAPFIWIVALKANPQLWTVIANIE